MGVPNLGQAMLNHIEIQANKEPKQAIYPPIELLEQESAHSKCDYITLIDKGCYKEAIHQSRELFYSNPVNSDHFETYFSVLACALFDGFHSLVKEEEKKYFESGIINSKLDYAFSFCLKPATKPPSFDL